mmetsp:Transcript_14872/g.41407  ORF Transcript_14872/g.41407 Transcript_14872/m.41407 type:complete len:1532 (+) Transcript_14872:243-4838(+)
MDWDMNQELLAEEETEYTEYSYGEEEEYLYGRNNSNSSNDSTSYEMDDHSENHSQNDHRHLHRRHDYDYDPNQIPNNAESGGITTSAARNQTGRTSDDSNENQNQNENARRSRDGENHNGFEIKGPLVLWDDDDYDYDAGNYATNGYGFSFPLSSASAAEFNAHGVVHVRLLRARNLPCPVGSNVGAVVSLPPYKGKVKSIRSKAFAGRMPDHGVCIRWGKERKQPPKLFTDASNDLDSNWGDDDYCTDDGDDDGDGDLEEDGKNLLSMVNAWNGPNSPVPSIRIELTFSPLGLGIFDFSMASIELSSGVLLQRPRVWRTRWCPMRVASSSSSQINYHHNHNDDPFIRVQALFEPSVSDSGPVEFVAHNAATAAARSSSSPPMSTTSLSTLSTLSTTKTNDPQSATIPPTPSGKSLYIETNAEARNTGNDDKDWNGSQPVPKPNAPTITTDAKLGGGDRTIQTNAGHKTEPSKTVGDPASFWDVKELQLMTVDTSSFHNDEFSIAASKRTIASSQRTAHAATALVKPHLLRAQTYWAPTRCAVCSKLLVGVFRRGAGFRCEVCHIDCCSDCRLHVDLRVPCGSDLASDIVEASFRNKMSPSGLLSYIAPDEAYEQSRQSALEEHSKNRKKSTSSIISSKQSLAMTSYKTNGALSPLSANGEKSSTTMEGVGRCRFEIVTACLFLQNTSSLDEISSGTRMPALRKGDYYVRVSMSGSDRSARTPTLQKTGGMPHFRSAEMRFPVSHYGVEFRIDVVEADTDTIIGSAFLTTQGILQEQRDAYIAEHGVSLLQFFKGPIPWRGTRKMKLMLRSGIKAGARSDEFYSSSTSSKGSSVRHKGTISGWLDICVGVEEFYSRLYGQNPIKCPNRPPEDLNIAIFSNYIGRITAIIRDLKDVISLYQHMMSWKDPLWTAVSLAIFLCFCLLFNAEYSGSLPILFFIAFLAYSAFQRNEGKMKDRYIQKEVETMQKVEGHSIGYDIYRPRGTVTVAVSKGRNLLSPEFGIAGKTSCKIIWDPLRFADEEAKERILKSDKSADTPFEMGDTLTIYTSDPDWTELKESAIAKRLIQLLPSTTNDFFDSSSEMDAAVNKTNLSFPILQPFDSSDLEKDTHKLGAWESSQAAIVLQVKFQDFFNNIPGFDYVLGEVVFPFSDLTTERELQGWFQILNVGTNSLVHLEDNEVDKDVLCGTSLNPPRIHAHLKWDPPERKSSHDPCDEEREMSRAIQEELLRSSIILKENKVNLVDSSIGSVSKAFGIGGTIQVVQNTLGSIIDLIEGIINILNFTDPYKSSTILVGSVLVCALFCIIPTRYIILLAGLAQYGAGFVHKYCNKFIWNKSERKAAEPNGETDGDQRKSSPFVTKIFNAVRSIPTNEDLRKAYFWESRYLGTENAKKYAVEKRETRLEKLWKAKWHSPIKILVQDNEMDHSQQPMFHWESGFAVVQGHRFIWWKSVDDFDDGELQAGKLILSGHAGLGGPSPIEMRKLDREDELPLCLTVFGRGLAGQERVTMLLPQKDVKHNLENCIIHSASFKSD